MAEFTSGREALLRVMRGDHSALAEFFDSRFEEWPHPFRNDELVSYGLFTVLPESLGPHQAFDLIDAASEVAVQNAMSEQRFVCALELLTTLVGASETTEMPSGLEARWS